MKEIENRFPLILNGKELQQLQLTPECIELLKGLSKSAHTVNPSNLAAVLAEWKRGRAVVNELKIENTEEL